MGHWFEDDMLNAQLDLVTGAMRDHLHSGNKQFNEATLYLQQGGGKLLRPAF